MSIYREGYELEFEVLRVITDPGDEAHFVLAGPDGRRFLLPQSGFRNYDIAPGMRIACSVTRVSCTGEVVLEPANPWYKEGQYYFFEVVRKGTDGGRNCVTVRDRSGEVTTVEVHGKLPGALGRIKLMVERIDRGKLLLRWDTGILKGTRMKIGEDYEFSVTGTSKGSDDRDYFIVSDPFGRNHFLRCEYYSHYGIRTGEKITGKVIKVKPGGIVVIEPENPFFKAGSLVRMKISGYARNEGDDNYIIGLTDSLGNSHCIEMTEIPSGPELECRIRMIRKGRLILEKA